MARQLRKRPTRNQCNSRLSMLSMLSSHISTKRRDEGKTSKPVLLALVALLAHFCRNT